MKAKLSDIYTTLDDSEKVVYSFPSLDFVGENTCLHLPKIICAPSTRHNEWFLNLKS